MLLGYFGSGQRRYIAGVVGAVSEQDNAFRLGFAILDAVDGCRKSVSDRGTVLQHTHLYVVDIVGHHGTVGGHWQ